LSSTVSSSFEVSVLMIRQQRCSLVSLLLNVLNEIVL
jgi:hypothetical protein